MIGTREICALLLAGGMGAGSVVTVQKVVDRPATTKRVVAHKTPKVIRKAAPKAAPQTRILDCPTPGLGGDMGTIAGLTPAPNWQPQSLTGSAVAGVIPPYPVTDGGGWIVTPPSIQPPMPPDVGGVPEPASWAMMIAGFGVIGLAARRKANKQCA